MELDDLDRIREQIAGLELAIRDAQQRRNALIAAALAVGIGPTVIAKRVGVARSRVYQLRDKPS